MRIWTILGCAMLSGCVAEEADVSEPTAKSNAMPTVQTGELQPQAETTRVNKIEAISFKAKVAQDDVGE
jgi:hypothetical protein